MRNFTQARLRKRHERTKMGTRDQSEQARSVERGGGRRVLVGHGEPAAATMPGAFVHPPVADVGA